MWIDGHGVMDISRDPQVNMGQKTVSKWIKRFREGYGTVPDEDLVLDKPRTGRPTTMTEKVRDLVGPSLYGIGLECTLEQTVSSSSRKVALAIDRFGVVGFSGRGRPVGGSQWRSWNPAAQRVKWQIS